MPQTSRSQLPALSVDDGARRRGRAVALVTAAVLMLLGLLTGVAPAASAAAPVSSITAWGAGWTYSGQDELDPPDPPASLVRTGATAVDAGDEYGLALTPAGKVVAWGDDEVGQLDVPSSLAGKTVTAISAGRAHNLALTSDGTVVAWGDDQFGRTDVPASLAGRTVTAISAGETHNLALTSDGTVVAWGDDEDGQTDVPASLNGKTVTAVAAGGDGHHSLALTSDGTVTAWGFDFDGQTDVPASLAGKTVTAISAGGYHSLALTSDGKVTAWGFDVFGQSEVPASLADKTVTAISAGGLHNVVVTSDGKVTAWGLDGDGQSDVPASLAGKTVTAVSAGFRLSLALTPGVSPVVSASPASTTVEVGAEASFTAAATGDPAPTVRWQRADLGGAFEDLPGATSTTFTFSPVLAEDGARFRAVFTNASGSATTDAATLSVEETSNTAPTANNLVVTAGFESATTVTLDATDPDGDLLTYAVVSQPDHGALAGSGKVLTYTPDDGYTGDDAFTYLVDDGTVDSTIATVELTVTPRSCVPDLPRRRFSVDVDQRDRDGKVRTAKFSTKKTGELLLAHVAANGPTPGTQSVTGVTGGGLTWTLVRRDNTLGGTSEIWQAYAPTRLRSTRVEASLAVQGYSVTMTVAGFTGARPTVGAAGHASGTVSAPEVSLTPQASGSVVWAVGRVVGSRYDPKPVSGQKVVHDETFRSPRTGYWIQRTTRATTAGTPVTVGDRSAAESWGYAAVEIRGVCD